MTVLCYNYNSKRELFRTYVCWLLSSRPVVHKCCFWQRKLVIQKMVWFCKVNSYSLLSLYILLDSLDCSSAMPTSTTSILTFSLFCSSPMESVNFACKLSLLLFFHSLVHQVAGRNSCFLCILLTKYHSFRDCAMDRR